MHDAAADVPDACLKTRAEGQEVGCHTNVCLSQLLMADEARRVELVRIRSPNLCQSEDASQPTANGP